MKIEKGCSPNCSEATMRFRTNKLTKDEEEQLFGALKSYVEDYNYETNVFKNKIFGIRCITVDGNAPYNAEKEIREKVAKLSFIKKVTIEMEEE